MTKHIMGENQHTSDGKHVCGRWNDLPHVKRMKYRMASCRAPITAVRSQRGGEMADPWQALSLNAHTQTANMAIMKQIQAEARVWQWHLHSLLNSFFPLPNMHGHTHTQYTLRSQRPWEEEQHQGIKKPFSLPWVYVRFSMALWED